MQIPKRYDHLSSEEKWFQTWQEQELFRSQPDEREPYTIVMPPPNVTGILHMGHMLNNTIQDVLIRRARMQGYNACWVPGTDHASIATEAKVVAKLAQEGLNKQSLGREAFLEHAWAWTHKHGGIIQEQLKKLGCSCDWSREAFTMDEVRSESVLRVFVQLYEKGLIYRGYRMVNWDPQAQTTLSDEEVVYREEDGQLYFLRYPLVGEEGHLTVATTRPETILGDTALCVHPDDDRYRHLVGKKVQLPLAGREIPVIADAYVDPEFGTGCLKITPAHDPNDYAIGQRYNLPMIDIFHPDGTLNAKGLHYEGQDRFAVRKAIAQELQEKAYLLKTESHRHKVGTSERTGAVVEPRLSDQWFLRMKELAQPALEAVLGKKPSIDLIPEKFKNTYRHWMENVLDWNISRQLWWGHQIPAWYVGGDKEKVVVALDSEEALTKAQALYGKGVKVNDLQQEEDVLDTWFSSWIWPISVFDGIRRPDNEEIRYYYPTRDLVTAPEILFFWVARMIMLGYALREENPFRKVYLTGIVRDKQGRKMSKSLGNSPDPLDLMEKYSTDGVRVGMLLTSPAGNDLPFDEDLCEQGRNFSNKIWNALRLVKSWQSEELPVGAAEEAAMAWFEAKLASTLTELEQSFERYRISEALMTAYRFAWDDFCSWYLEAIKPGFGQPMAQVVYQRSLNFFEAVLKVLHPFMPFITEEIWHLLRERASGDSICVAQWPKAEAVDESLIRESEQALQVVMALRKLRADKGISPKQALELCLPSEEALSNRWRPLTQKLAQVKEFRPRLPEDRGLTFLAGKHEYLVPLEEQLDPEAEKAKLRKELEYLEGFLKSVSKKLANERFVQNAPEAVVQKEQAKKADAEAKISALRRSLEAL